MFKLDRYTVPDVYGAFGQSYITLNDENIVITTTPTELFSYQVADGYAHPVEKQFDLTIVFLNDEAFSNGLETLMWLTDSGKEGRLRGKIAGDQTRFFYMYCTCVGITAIQYDDGDTRKITATFYAREPFWIEEQQILVPSGSSYIYADIRVPTRMDIQLAQLDKQFVQLKWYNVETKEEREANFSITQTASSTGDNMFTTDHYKKVIQGNTFDLSKASFYGYISGDWFPTLLPARKGNNQGSYRFSFKNSSLSGGSGTISSQANAVITLLKLRGLPF